jgi:hypothetical protein
MSWSAAPIAHVEEALGVNGGTSSAIDTTGADFIVAFIAADGGVVSLDTLSIQDSKSNTWVKLTRQWNSGDVGGQLFYTINPTVGTGHTFGCPTASSFSSIFVAAWSGSELSSPFDQQNGAANPTSTTHQPGSVTPTTNNQLVINAVGHGVTSASINGGFTKVGVDVALGPGNHYGGVMFFLVQTTAAAANSTATLNATSIAVDVIATFKANPTGPRFILGTH